MSDEKVPTDAQANMLASLERGSVSYVFPTISYLVMEGWAVHDGLWFEITDAGRAALARYRAHHPHPRKDTR